MLALASKRRLVSFIRLFGGASTATKATAPKPGEDYQTLWNPVRLTKAHTKVAVAHGRRKPSWETLHDPTLGRERTTPRRSYNAAAGL